MELLQGLEKTETYNQANTYFDGTKITAPFWVFRCSNPDCKWEGWSVTHKTTCKKCGQPAVSTPANVDKKTLA